MIDFTLPQELIAQEPVNPRDSARLLVYDRKTKQIIDAVFRDIGHFLHPYTTIVVNNSKVEQCRWLFNEGKLEIFVLEKSDTHTVRAMIRPGRKFRVGNVVQLTNWLNAEVMAIDGDGFRTLKLSTTHDDPRLKEYEHIPLPFYIPQNDALAEEYQTVYAKPEGSKAAPTAGLHFTDELLSKLKSDFGYAEVTLHVGLGTFAPLTEKNFESNSLHKESYEISDDVLRNIERSPHITAVGTTTARTLESWKKSGYTHGSTDIFIQPGFQFQRVDSMITNFHLPSTSLLLMIEAFIGDAAEMQKIYDHAIRKKYRFYSFGDAMLIV